MALITSRRSTFRGAPAGTGGGNNGSMMAHSASVRSLGYGWRRAVSMGSTLGFVIKDQP